MDNKDIEKHYFKCREKYERGICDLIEFVYV